MDSVYRRVALVLMLMFTFAFTSPYVVLATDLDAIQSQMNDGQPTQDMPSTNYNEYGGSSNDGNAISDYLRGYTPITQQNMQTASKTMSPIVSFLGTLSGCIVMFASAGIFVVTALDLCYIGLPFTRAWLNPQYNMAGGAAMGGGMPMGGFGGMGRMGGMMGGGMMGGGAQQPAQEYGIRRKWVSDEAVFCVNTYANGGMQQQGGMSPMGGMGGMGMGMGGMMGGGMMGGGMQPQQPMPTRSVVMEYFKKRVFFMIVFAVCTVMLMSSIFTDCGINLAELLNKVLIKVNGEISTLNV